MELRAHRESPSMPQILAVSANPDASSCRLASVPGTQPRDWGAKGKAARAILRAVSEPGGYPMRPGDFLVTCPGQHSGLRAVQNPRRVSAVAKLDSLLPPKCTFHAAHFGVVGRVEHAMSRCPAWNPRSWRLQKLSDPIARAAEVRRRRSTTLSRWCQRIVGPERQDL